MLVFHEVYLYQSAAAYSNLGKKKKTLKSMEIL